MKYVLGLSFLVSAVLLPWWVSVLFGIGVTLYPGSGVVLLIGGVIMDTLFGAPIATLGGFAYLYTVLFSIIAAVVYLLRDRVVD